MNQAPTNDKWQPVKLEQLAIIAKTASGHIDSALVLGIEAFAYHLFPRLCGLFDPSLEVLSSPVGENNALDRLDQVLLLLTC